MSRFLVAFIVLAVAVSLSAVTLAPPPSKTRPSRATMTSALKATFAAGCFWGVEITFQRTRGVLTTAVGYIGGSVPNPTYEQVCSKSTGHAEAVEFTYDPSQITFDHLLDVFFDNHDATQLNRQGPDVGDQYRSAIFYHSPEQKEAAEKKIAELQPKVARKIVTQIVSAADYPFYLAEDYHQQYLEKKGRSTEKVH